MDFLTPEKLALALRFLVPGVIIVHVRNLLVYNRPPAFSEAAVAYISLSFVYQALVFWVPTAPNLGVLPTGWAAIQWVLLLFVAPTAVGLVFGLDARKGWSRAVLSFVHIPIPHPTACAWDWRFGNCFESWIMVVLKDGTQWAGYLGEKAFLSTDPRERDLYLDDVYSIDDKNIWTQKGSSVWIAHGEIQSIEFWET